MVYDFCQMQIPLARILLKYVNCEVYYPFYLPAADLNLSQTYQMVFESYRLMTKDYRPEKIAVVGLSAGASIAMVLPSWNNFYQERLVIPPLTVAISPGHIPSNEDQIQMLYDYPVKDPFLSIDELKAYGILYRRGSGVEDWTVQMARVILWGW